MNQHNDQNIFGKIKMTTVSCFDLKKQIIDYLYSKLDINNYKYEMLNNIQKLKFLKENEHYVSFNYRGHSYFLIMMTINKKFYNFIIDRQKLNYIKAKLDLQKIVIFQIYINATPSLYEGSIFDGKFISNPINTFLIHDCFFLMGNNLLKMDMINKMIYLDSIIKSNFKQDIKNVNFKLNKLVSYNKLEEIITYATTNQHTINGIIFYPKVSGINIIKIADKFNKVDIVSNNEKIEYKTYDIISDYVNFLKSRIYSYENEGKKKYFG